MDADDCRQAELRFYQRDSSGGGVGGNKGGMVGGPVGGGLSVVPVHLGLVRCTQPWLTASAGDVMLCTLMESTRKDSQLCSKVHPLLPPSPHLLKASFSALKYASVGFFCA